MAEVDELALIDMPRYQHVLLAIAFLTQLLFGLNFGIAPMPDIHRGLFFLIVRLFVFIFVFIFVLVFLGELLFPLGQAEEDYAAIVRPLGLMRRKQARTRGEFRVFGWIVNVSSLR